MPWDSNGNFTRDYNWEVEAANGDDIEGVRMNNDAENFREGIQDCINRRGFNTPLADLPMGGTKHTGVGNAGAVANYGVVGQIQNSAYNFATNVDSSDGLAYTMSVMPPAPSLVDGFNVAFVPNIDNTGEVTFEISGGTEYPVVMDGAVLGAGDLVTGRVYTAYFYGSTFHIISGGSGSGTPAQSIFSGAQVAFRDAGAQQLIPNSDTGTILTWNQELMDTDDYYNPADPTMFQAPVDGVYMVSANILLAMFNRQVSSANNVAQGFMNEDSTDFGAGMQTGPPGGVSRTIMAYCGVESWLEALNPGPDPAYAIGGTQTSNFLINFPFFGADKYISSSIRSFIALGAGSKVYAKTAQQGCMVDMIASNFHGFHQATGSIEVIGASLWHHSSWFSIEKVRDGIPEPIEAIPS